MNDFQTQIVDIDESTLDGLFDETPAGTPGADTLIGTKKPEAVEEKVEEPVDDKKKKPAAQQQQRRTDIIEDVDLDLIEEENEEEEEKIVTETPEQKAIKEAAKKSAEKVEEPKKVEDKTEVLSVLKTTVDYLIESGQWQDFEGREDLDVTEEVYANLVREQDQLRVKGMFEELVDSTGPFGKAIIEFVKNGGSPDEIIDLFKEQKQVESISIDAIDGQKDMIKHYYTEVMGWKPEKVEKYISQLMLSGEVENEAKETKELFSNFYKKEAERLNKERGEYAAQQKQAEVEFETNIRNTIKDRKDLSLSERKTVEDYLLSYDQRLPNGNMVNKFYVNFAKMQANPADYVDLVLFTMDKQKFMQKVQTQEKTKAAAETFKFIKGNAAVSTKKGSQHEQVKKSTETKETGLNWGLPKKK